MHPETQTHRRSRPWPAKKTRPEVIRMDYLALDLTETQRTLLTEKLGVVDLRSAVRMDPPLY